MAKNKVFVAAMIMTRNFVYGSMVGAAFPYVGYSMMEILDKYRDSGGFKRVQERFAKDLVAYDPSIQKRIRDDQPHSLDERLLAIETLSFSAGLVAGVASHIPMFAQIEENGVLLYTYFQSNVVARTGLAVYDALNGPKK